MRIYYVTDRKGTPIGEDAYNDFLDAYDVLKGQPSGCMVVRDDGVVMAGNGAKVLQNARKK